MRPDNPHHPTKQWFAAEPESPLKTAVEMLWEFAALHGLNMDNCGRSCAQDVLLRVADLKHQAVLKDAELEKLKEEML